MVALGTLKADEWLIVAPHDGGTNVARSFLNSNKTIGADVVFNYVTVETSNNDGSALMINNKYFYGPSVLINGYGAVASLDFAIYSYGYTGRVVKNGWSEAFVIDMTTGKVVRIYDGVNNKYYDADNTSGIAGTGIYEVATTSFAAFESLKPNELLVIGLNGGRNTNAGRAFLVGNRTYNAVCGAISITLPTPETTTQTIKAIVVDGDKYYVSTLAKDAGATSATVPFLVYSYGYSGSIVSNGYGVAIIVKNGKIVRIYDGASGKYFDADNTGGVSDATKCTAGGYLSEAFASLTEGETLLCAPNGGTTGNVARGFLYDHRSIGKDVTIPTFE